MAKLKLTEKFLARLQRGDSPQPGRERHWDAETPGLFVIAGARGAVFWCKAERREVRIGRVAEWTLEEARSRCRELRRGEVPAEPERLPTLCQAFASFEAVRLVKRRLRTAREYRAQLEKYAFPQWGNRPVDQITRQDVVQLHHRMTLAGRPIMANRIISTLSSLFNWLRRDGGMAIDNPATGIERNAEHGREVYLTAAQVVGLRAALDAVPGKDAAVDCLQFILATGCRSGEARSATWEQFDEALTTWTKPASVTKQKKLHRIPIGPAAQSILLRRRGLRKGEAAVFPPVDGRGEVLDIRKAWRIATAAAGLNGVRIHDMRHTYASLAISSGVPLKTLGGLLGHSAIATTNRYAHLYEDDLRAAAGAVNAKLEGGKN